jgi:hypothetical protein
MAIQLLGGDGVSVAAVDPQHSAQRVSLRPPQALGFFSIGAQSGALTAVGANGPVFALRNASSNLIMIKRVGVGFILTTAFTTPQIVDFGLAVARSWTAADAGGTAIAVTGNNGKHRTSLASPVSLDARIAAAAALTAGTRTLDANTLGQIGAWAGAIGAGVTPSPDNLFSHNTGDHPLILAQNEGIIIQAMTAMGATGIGRLYVNIEFGEVGSY